MNSFKHFFLDETVLIEFRHVLSIVDLISTCLSQWNYEAFAQTAENKDGHDAEVEDHGAVGVHLLGA